MEGIKRKKEQIINMTDRKRLIKAIIYLSNKKLNRNELIELSSMSTSELISKLISVSYSNKYPVRKETKIHKGNLVKNYHYIFKEK